MYLGGITLNLKFKSALIMLYIPYIRTIFKMVFSIIKLEEMNEFGILENAIQASLYEDRLPTQLKDPRVRGFSRANTAISCLNNGFHNALAHTHKSHGVTTHCYIKRGPYIYECVIYNN
jgi:hypothetical protein